MTASLATLILWLPFPALPARWEETLVSAALSLMVPLLLAGVGECLTERAVLRHEVTVSRAYNVAGPDCLTTREYYETVALTLGIERLEVLSLPSDVYVQAFPEKAPFALHRMYSTDRLFRDTGYRPDSDVRHAVFAMVDWLQETDSAQPYVETEQEAALIPLCRRSHEQIQQVLAGM